MQFVVQGIFNAAPLTLVAIGFVILYNAIRAFQFAHGIIVMLAAYVFLLAYDHLGHSILIGLTVSIAVITVLSIAISVMAFEPLLGHHFPSLIVGLALIILVNEVAGRYFYSGFPVAFPDSMRVDGYTVVGGVFVQYSQLFVLAVSLFCIVVLDQYFRHSRLGMQMRSLADSPVGAELCGISVKRTIRLAFVLAGLTAVIAGILVGILYNNLTPTLGDQLTIPVAASVLVAGPTSMRGAVVATWLFGITESVVVGYFDPAFSTAAAYAIVVVLLLLKPDGLFGRPVEHYG